MRIVGRIFDSFVRWSLASYTFVDIFEKTCGTEEHKGTQKFEPFRGTLFSHVEKAVGCRLASFRDKYIFPRDCMRLPCPGLAESLIRLIGPLIYLLKRAISHGPGRHSSVQVATRFRDQSRSTFRKSDLDALTKIGPSASGIIWILGCCSKYVALHQAIQARKGHWFVPTHLADSQAFAV